MIRNCTPDDAAAICQIYNHYISNSICTFELEPVAPATMAERIRAAISRYPWIVLEKEGMIHGYAYANKWKLRKAYEHTVETTVYVSPHDFGRGTGTGLMKALLQRLTLHKFHCVVAGISLPNEVSISLHQKPGFVKVAHFKEIGKKFGEWIDVGYWQILLDDPILEFETTL